MTSTRHGLGERVAELEVAARHVAWAGSWPLADAVVGALASGGRSDLDDAVRRITGRGPGLTPAGDDVLVGVFAVLTAPGAAAACEPAAARLRAALAPALPTTTEISRALLRQASHGHVSRPVWELARTVLSGSAPPRPHGRGPTCSRPALPPVATRAPASSPPADCCPARSKGSRHEHQFALLPQPVQGFGLPDDGVGADHERRRDRRRVCRDGVGDQYRQPPGSRARAVRRPAQRPARRALRHSRGMRGGADAGRTTC